MTVPTWQPLFQFSTPDLTHASGKKVHNREKSVLQFADLFQVAGTERPLVTWSGLLDPVRPKWVPVLRSIPIDADSS